MASNCNTCGTCAADCNCIPTGLTTPSYCPSDNPPCPTPSPCAETFDSKCVIYTGDDLPCIDVTTGDSVDTIINTLNDLLEPFFCLQCTTLMVPANASTNVAYDQVLTWGAVQGATSYNVYFGTVSTNLILVSSGQIGTSYTYPYPFLEGTTYYWKVVPINAEGPASNCPTYSFTTKTNVCINPMSFVLTNVYNSLATPTSAAFATAISTYLTAGELLTNCNLCCPDCDTKRYVLASAPMFAQYYSTFYNAENCPPPCCIEVDASLTAMASANPTYPSLSTAFALTPPVTNCCGTNFSECNQVLKDLLGTSKNLVYSVNGIVEESTISGSTTLCILAQFLDNITAYTPADVAAVVNAILTKGLVIDCRPEGTIIAGIEAYADYIFTVQNGCYCYQPCSSTAEPTPIK
jgi:hypothetical protein